MKKLLFTLLSLGILSASCSKGTFVVEKIEGGEVVTPVEEPINAIDDITVQEGCQIVVNKEDVEVKWVAFKTPDKIGVTGYFNDLGINDQLKGTNLSQLFSATSFNIDTASTDLGSDLKNTNVIETFFQLMSSDMISGNFQFVSNEKVLVNLDMNSVQKSVPMKLVITEDTISGSGMMDVFDFSLQDSLAGINERCYDYHAGKTWNDVELYFSMKYKVECSN